MQGILARELMTTRSLLTRRRRVSRHSSERRGTIPRCRPMGEAAPFFLDLDRPSSHDPRPEPELEDGPLRIAFVHVPFGHRRFSENLKVVDEEFILSPPIILAYVAAIAERAGHQATIIDAHSLRLDRDAVVRRIREFGAEALCFRLDVYGFQDSIDWMRELKARTGLDVIAGGVAMSDYPADCMTHRVIDFGVTGEAVDRFPRLLSSIANGGEGLAAIDGITYRDGDEVVHNPPTGELASIDDYPFPARHLLPNEIYGSFVSQRRNFTIMLTSTGCPFNCVYCAIVKVPHRLRSPEGVMEEIEHCVRDHGVREIDFFDASLFVDRDRAMTLMEMLARRGLDLEWTCRSRLDHVDRELLALARRAGCRMIYYGIESGSHEILHNIHKELTPQQTRDGIRATREQGIRTLGFLMVGNPGETRETIRGTVRFARSLNLDYVQICRTIAKPGTALDRQLKQQTGRDYWAEFIRGDVGEERLPMPWIDMSQDELEDELKRAYYAFYFRPSHILRTLVQVRHPDELRRYTRVGLRMLANHFFTDLAGRRPYS